MIRTTMRRLRPPTAALVSLLVASTAPVMTVQAQPLLSVPSVSRSFAAPLPSAPATPLRATAGGIGLRGADVWKLGGLAVLAGVLATADRRGDAWARQNAVQESVTLDRLSAVGDFSGTWGAIGVGPASWLLGRARGDSGTAVLGLRTTEAVMLSSITIGVLKALTGRTRPYASVDHSPSHWDLFGGRRSDSTRSFASGHSAMSAAAAVTLAAEWRRQGRGGWKVVGPPLVYALAGVVAGSRVRDRKHWLSDVVAGSAVGVLSAIVVRRVHDAHPRSRVDRAFLAR